MSNRSGTQKLARALQKVAADELKARPSSTTCLRIAREDRSLHGQRLRREEQACALFAKHRNELEVSAALNKGGAREEGDE